MPNKLTFNHLLVLFEFYELPFMLILWITDKGYNRLDKIFYCTTKLLNKLKVILLDEFKT